MIKTIESFISKCKLWTIRSPLFLLTCFLGINFLLLTNLNSQVPASPSNWLYPNGNPEGTLYNPNYSDYWQSIKDFTIKWSTHAISGDVQPLIGNIINNNRIMSSFSYAPNEIAAVVGGKMIVVDAKGKVWANMQLPPFIQNISVLFDTNLTSLSDKVTGPVIMGLETIESENMKDSLAFAYLAGFNHLADSVAMLKRLAIDLRPYKPNISASIKPFFGKREGNKLLIYSTVNMVSPLVADPPPLFPAYYRGMAVFHADIGKGSYLIPDIGDIYDSRIHMASNINMNQPSMLRLLGGQQGAMFSVFPEKLDTRIDDPIFGFSTYRDKPYLVSANIGTSATGFSIYPTDLTSEFSIGSQMPYVRGFYVNLFDSGIGINGIYLLISEGYTGIDGSTGEPRLHLCYSDGRFITSNDDPVNPSFKGTKDHLWSVAVGNVDGNATNNYPGYFTNNPGNEIIVTQSSREFAVAGSMLTVLRFNTDTVRRTSPPGTFLYPFDKICSYQINGWVAAVNDLDRNENGKDEIIMVDGSTLRILNMRDYTDDLFIQNEPFDTLFTYVFKNETISSVAVADLEGDGLNDIIVTTYDSTYVIGSLVRNILDVINPIVESSPPEEYCAGDTVKIRWVNRMKGQNYVNIHYNVYLNNIRTGIVIPIDSNIVNDKDTMQYNYIVDNEVIGTDGKFIVESSLHPRIIYDSTAILRLNNPFLVVDSLIKKTFYPGDFINFTGRVACVDSVKIEFELDSAMWMSAWNEPILYDWTYDISAEIPCLDFFECVVPDRDSILNARIVAYKDQWADTSNIFNLTILPKPFPIYYDSCLTNCPTMKFKWDKTKIDVACDSVVISISPSGSGTFSFMDVVSLDDEEYVWLVPLNMPDSVYLRFCCAESCMRTDTILRKYRPSYIDIVAPNPFNPNLEQLEITYQVPSETNVSIMILDQANRFVAHLIKSQRRLPNIAYCDRWDGIIWDGSHAQNGMYYLLLEMSNGIREVHPVFVRK